MKGMENYKIESYDYRTFERKDLETNVSRNLVNQIELALKDMENITLGALIVNPETLGVSFGIIEDTDNGKELTHYVIIEPREYSLNKL